MTEKQDYKFVSVTIPASLWTTKDLTLIEKIVLVEIFYLDKAKGCYATNAHFAEMFGRSEWTISTTIANLKKKELVYEAKFDGRIRVLKISDFGKTQYLTLGKPNRESINRDKKNSITSNTNDADASCHGSFQKDSSIERTNLLVPPKEKKKASSGGRHWAVEYWNNLPPLPIIPPKDQFSNQLTPKTLPKHHNPNTKSYHNAARYLSQLHGGSFLNGKPKWTRNLVSMFKSRGIPVALLSESWERDKMFIALSRLSKVYYTDIKVRSLAQLIYNPYTNPEFGYYSYFFDVFYNYKKLKWRIENREDEPMESYTIYLKKDRASLREEGWDEKEIDEMFERQRLLNSKGQD